jgi:hypothetical protein
MTVMRWCGYWMEGVLYFPGEVLVYNGKVYIAREETQQMPTSHSAYGWVSVGKHEPHSIDHPWLPEPVAFPLPDGQESGETLLCRECWTTSNFVMSFRPEAHVFLIQEMP